MDTGLKLSLAGHAAVLLLSLVGWPFGGPRTPSEPVVMDVALFVPGDLTQPLGPIPQAIETPPDVTDAPPPPPPPPPEDAPETAAPDETSLPDIPAPPPPNVDRVAPVPQPAPPEPVREADTQQPEIAASPDPSPDAVPAPEQDATAPEAAAPEIVTEATETDDAPATAAPPPAPRQRPDRPAPVASAPDPTPPPPADEPEAAPAPDPAPPAAVPDDAVNDAVAAALADALGGTGGGGGAAGVAGGSLGGSLTNAERDGLRIAVGRCWNVGALGTDAMQVVVTVAMDMGRDGTPSNLRLLSHTGGSDSAAEQAYDTARRAILRCAPFDLPQDRYDQWRRIEMTFNPADMGRR